MYFQNVLVWIINTNFAQLYPYLKKIRHQKNVATCFMSNITAWPEKEACRFLHSFWMTLYSFTNWSMQSTFLTLWRCSGNAVSTISGIISPLSFLGHILFSHKGGCHRVVSVWHTITQQCRSKYGTNAYNYLFSWSLKCKIIRLKCLNM